MEGYTTCWSNGSGGCLTLLLNPCTPSTFYPSRDVQSVGCLITSPDDPGFWFGLSVQANLENNNCEFWLQVPAQWGSPDTVGDPVNPSLANVTKTEEDGAFAGASSDLKFDRFYNSVDLIGTDMGPSWRHSYDRSVSIIYTPVTAPYTGPNTWVSPQYADQPTACTAGFPTIRAQVNGWQNLTATWDNGGVLAHKSFWSNQHVANLFALRRLLRIHADY